jgi:catechol-2,3-dioxygenase
MTDENSSIISHISIGTNNFEGAAAFYDAVLTILRTVFKNI